MVAAPLPDESEGSVAQTGPRRRTSRRRLSLVNWRVASLRALVNGILVWLVLWAFPAVDAELIHPFLAFALVAAIYGLLDAYVRPGLDLLLMPFAVQTYGVALVAVDVILLTLLIAVSDIFLPVQVASLWWVVAAGLVLGVLKLAVAGLLGLTPPVVPDPPSEPEPGA